MRGQRFLRRTWRKTSEYICAANGFAPGFRIILLDDEGRARRSDLLVRSGAFGAYPSQMSVRVFLNEIILNHLKNPGDIGHVKAELRSHLNERVDADLSLRRVRDMTGEGGHHSQEYDDDEDMIQQIQEEIGQAVDLFENDPVFEQHAHLDDLIVKALIGCIFDRFYADIDLIEQSSCYFAHKLSVARNRTNLDADPETGGSPGGS
jgi:hypothetical protein